MPTKDPRYSIRVTEEMEKRIIHFWHDNEIRNKNEATIQLIEIGLRALDNKQVVYTPQDAKRRPVQDEPSADAMDISKQYDRLDSDYQRLVKSTVRTLLKEQALRSGNQDAKTRE